MSSVLTIGYFADGPWAHRALDRLLEDPAISIAFICLRHDCPDPVLQQRAADRGIDLFTHARINSDEFLDQVRPYSCDLFVSMSFNQIFGKRLIQHARFEAINCHAGKLPFYRGRNVLNWALINDEKEFGITVHYIDEGIDTGDILSQRILPITDADDYSTLLRHAYEGCADLLYQAIKQIHTGTAVRTPQSSVHPTGFYCTRRTAGDERLDWNQASRDIFNFVRAVCRPGPEARTLRGDTELKINRVEWIPEAPEYKGVPGAVIAIEKRGVIVKTRDSFVRVTEWTGEAVLRVGDRLT